MLPFLKNTTSNFGNAFTEAKSFFVEQYIDFFDYIRTSRVKSKDLVRTNYELGLEHIERGNLSDAILRFRLALWLRKILRSGLLSQTRRTLSSKNTLPAVAEPSKTAYEDAMIHYQLGRTYLLRGEISHAERSFAQAQLLRPDFPEVDYFTAVLRNQVPKETMLPLSVVADYFNNMAATYNQFMINELHYNSYIPLIDTAVPLLPAEPVAAEPAQVLELGCGTGMCGQLLKEKYPTCVLTGIDISRAMLKEARLLEVNGLRVYDSLKLVDIQKYAETTDRFYHMMIAGLSMNYLGDLGPSLRALKTRLLPGGSLLLTVQFAPAGEVSFTEDMKSFRYSREYLDRQATEAGFAAVALRDQSLYDNCPGLLGIFTT